MSFLYIEYNFVIVKWRKYIELETSSSKENFLMDTIGILRKLITSFKEVLNFMNMTESIYYIIK